jgi:5-methylcytosine-specific restriction protein B
MSDQLFLSNLQQVYSTMLATYPKGLSDTSIRKFDALKKLFATRLSIDGEQDIYAIGSGSRPGNIEVRLSQGVRAFLHTKLGIAIIKSPTTNEVQGLSDSAVTTITGFLERGKAAYDSILVLVELFGKALPTRLVTYRDSPVLNELMIIFDGLEHFKRVDIVKPEMNASAQAVASASTRLDKEKWRIPDEPAGGDFDFPIQRLIEGCPGSGKSFRLEADATKADRVIRTVFHPESGFSDFIGFLSPETAFRIDMPSPTFNKGIPGVPYVYYEFCCGPLLEAYVLAVLNPHHRVVLIVEELSRAPASLVFGDTLQLLDRIKSGDAGVDGSAVGYSRYEIRPKGDVQAFLESIDASPPYTQPGCMRFPSNLFIWATMNRADQNAKQLDTAFLRRWNREHISHDTGGVLDDTTISYAGKIVTWAAFRSELNMLLLQVGAREDKLIGAYFLSESSLSNPASFADDLLAYVWHDVLREDGRDVFPGIYTFSELRERWISGQVLLKHNAD